MLVIFNYKAPIFVKPQIKIARSFLVIKHTIKSNMHASAQCGVMLRYHNSVRPPYFKHFCYFSIFLEYCIMFDCLLILTRVNCKHLNPKLLMPAAQHTAHDKHASLIHSLLITSSQEIWARIVDCIVSGKLNVNSLRNGRRKVNARRYCLLAAKRLIAQFKWQRVE